jgi:non-homologous end joining protein Ku
MPKPKNYKPAKVIDSNVKAYVSNFTLRLGPINSNGRLVGVRLPSSSSTKKNGSFKLCNPNGRIVKQIYIDPADDSLWEYADLVKGVANEDGETAVIVNQEDIDEAKNSYLPQNLLELTVHNSDEVDYYLFPSDNNAYVFEPNPKDPSNLVWHSALLQLLNDRTDKVLIGVANVKNYEGLYKVVLWRERIVLQKMLYPESLNNHQPLQSEYTPEIDDVAMGKLNSMLDTLTQDFSPNSYQDSVAERVAKLKASLEDGVEHQVVFNGKNEQEFDIMKVLDAFEVLNG